MKKILIVGSLLFACAVAHAAPIINVQISTGSLQPNTTNGFYLQRSTSIVFNTAIIQSTNGIVSIQISTAGVVTITTFSGNVITSTSGVFNTIQVGTMTIGDVNSGGTPLRIQQDKLLATETAILNMNPASTSHAVLSLNTIAGGGDPQLRWNSGNSGGTQWYMGIDNGNGNQDTIFIGTGSVIGSSIAIQMAWNGLVTLNRLALTNALSLSTGTISVFLSTSVRTTDLAVLGNVTSSITVNGGAFFLNKIFVSTSSGIMAAFSVTDTSATINVPTYIRGTQTNDNAPTGYVGQIIQSIGNTGNIASNTWIDVSTLPLTAGDWTISSLMSTAPQTINPVFSRVQIGISSTAGNNSTGLSDGDNLIDCFLPTSASNKGGCSIPQLHIQLASPTTYYLKANAVWITDNVRFNGRGTATRVR